MEVKERGRGAYHILVEPYGSPSGGADGGIPPSADCEACSFKRG